MQYPFDGSSLQFEGTWYNPKTGDKVVVRDTLFENNQIVIRTNDGRMIPYDKFQNYVKSDKPIQMMNQKKPAAPSESIPQEVLSEIAPADDLTLEKFDDRMNRTQANVNNSPVKNTTASMINTNIYDSSVTRDDVNRYAQTTDITPFVRPVQSNVNINQEIIKKALGDKPRLKYEVKVSWKDCPIESIKALVDMFGISKEELVEYYSSQIDKAEIEEAVKAAIVNVFTHKEEKKEEPKAEPKVEEPKKEKKPVGRPKGSGKKK